MIWDNLKAGVMANGLDWSLCPAVESVPGKVSGAWVLRGTRMPVSAIFENLEAGASIDDILEWFDGLDREQVKAVIEFAARSLDKTPTLTYQEGWDKLRNGELLAAAEAAGFGLFLTTDKNIRCQQNLAGRKIAVVVLGQQQ